MREVLWRRILRGIGRLLDDTQRDLGVIVTALVERAVCECTDACRVCELPGNALALSVYILVEIHQKIYDSPPDYTHVLVLVCPLVVCVCM